jgi:diaminohydroxyphosphoribosylaminopyrimidine deaminase / 5-amino-6-(5-phosphoribosylamino)uracil reductase
MHRCLQLAAKGAGWVAPNPMVGAVLVHNGRIIGEGWHGQFGGPHAEVNAVAAVAPADRYLIPQATLYVSLEPCSHTGKTPPCTALILKEGIRKVVIGCIDPFAAVNGSGIEALRNAGVEVVTGVLEKDCLWMNRRFITFHQKKRPYVVLKWAQTADGFMGSGTTERLHISGPLTNRLVHRWRSEEAAVMVGKRTALLDNPRLNNRHAGGAQPLRVVTDNTLQLPPQLHLFDGRFKTVILNTLKDEQRGTIQLVKIPGGENRLQKQLQALHGLQVQSILVEGGAQLLQCFLAAGWWDELRVITNTALDIKKGIPAPEIKGAILQNSEMIENDRVDYYLPAS